MSDQRPADQEKKVNYKDTLNLPRTDFPIRAQAHIFDKELLQRWKEEKLALQAMSHNKGKETFILHDGPPYANGNIHLGHAYNKILKDIVTKSERMQGKHVPVTPGWDCHGLPIELKVVKESPGLEGVAFKKACRTYADKWVKTQSQEFEDLGVLMDWEKPYLTMNHSYESSIMRAFGKFVEGGYIEKKLKTVPWCASCATVLANAEIEYAERKDPSIYVQFPFGKDVSTQLFPQAGDREVSLLIWTTTPWTLPLNRGVVLKPGAMYQLIEINGQSVILGKALVAKLAEQMQAEAKVIAEFEAEHILGHRVKHPFVQDLYVPIIGDPFVSLEDGTACVHTAPGCGPEDYEIGRKNNLEIYSPLTVDGKYSSEIEPQELVGMPVSEGQIWVIKKLAAENRLLFKKSIRHSYPHCWRCQNGLIFRATAQWFCDLSKHDLKARALQAIENIQMLPATGKARLQATVEGRLEWCLSRQRSWGVPIPAVLCVDCDDVHISAELVEKVAQGVEKEGVEFWDTVDLKDLMGNPACGSCGSENVRKEHDILDVWFDSGVSHYAVLHSGQQHYPADMYLEGKDQHRGWFQSSLLSSLVLEDTAAMKSILTHGFTVDEKGYKMSKSRGNVVSPQEIVDRMGTDGLRLWVASNDYDSDPVVSKVLFDNVAEVYRKVRNTCRFLLSNLYDFNHEVDSVSVEELQPIDQYALYQLDVVNKAIMKAYKQRKTTAVFHLLADYCVKELSSFYLDVIKDRLYVAQNNGHERRSAQTVCYVILDVLTRAMAPILSFTAELVSDHYQGDTKRASIHLQDMRDISEMMEGFATIIKENITTYVDKSHAEALEAYAGLWQPLREVRSYVLKELERLREQGVIRHSLEARVQLHISEVFEQHDQFYQLLQFVEACNMPVQDFFKELCIVSSFEVVTDAGDMLEVAPGVFIAVSQAKGKKCHRCWQWSVAYDDNLMVCERCKELV